MKTVQVAMKPGIYHRAAALAAARECSLEALLNCLTEDAIEAEAPADRTMGLFADEPDLIDAIVEEAMADRERRGMPAARG